MQHGTWAKLGAEGPNFPFTGKCGINVDLEDTSNPLQYLELFCTPDIVEVIARETNRYAQQFLENTSNLEVRSRSHHWKETDRNEIMKLLAFFLLQGLHQKPNKRSYFSWRKTVVTPTFFNLFSEWRFHLLLNFLHSVDNKSYDKATCSYKDCTNSSPYWIT
jgi:hypothetical protein